MRPAVVRILDIGVADNFDAAGSFARSVIDSLTWHRYRDQDNSWVPWESPPAEVEFIRSRSWGVLANALASPATVLHLLAHGHTAPEQIGFWSDDGSSGIKLGDLADALDDAGESIQASVIYADCCSTATGRFVRAIRDCIGADTVYIGASRSVDWQECTLFGSLFYGSYFKDKGKGLDPVQRGSAAAARAIDGYQAAVAGACPFKASVLRPSRRALTRTP